jgi:hypothetical protein
LPGFVFGRANPANSRCNFQLIRVLADIVELFSINVGPFSRKVGWNRPMLSRRRAYVFSSLHLAKRLRVADDECQNNSQFQLHPTAFSIPSVELTEGFPMMIDYDLEGAAHVVQLALTPVFLLSGTATLLSVFAARLARVADRVDALSQEAKGPIRDELLTLLRRRSHTLDVAVVLSALAGGLTCAAVLVLFLGEVRGTAAARLLFASFGGAIVLTMASLVAFVVEMLLAARGVRRTVDRHTHP